MFKYKNKKKKYSQRKKAFSFMEVILVVAIIGIMTSVVLTFVGQSKHNTELEAAANEVVASIRKIQNYALSGKEVSPGCSKYRLVASVGANNFVIDNGGPTCPFNKSYQLKNGVTFSNGGVVEFSAPFADRSVTTTVDFIVTKGSYNYHICVTGVGVVTMQGSAC